MARTELTVQDVDRSGLNATYTSGDSTNDHSFENLTEDIVLHIKNAGTGACVVTVDIPITPDGQAVTDKSVTVPAAGERFFGPFPKAVYNQEDAGNSIDEAVLVDLDQDDNVTLAAIRVEKA